MNIFLKVKLAFVTSIIFLLFMSSIFLIIPFAVNSNDSNNTKTLVLGILFWVSALIGYISIIIASKFQKQCINEKNKKHIRKNKRVGLITFFSNVPAKISDIIFIFSFILFVIINLTDLRFAYFAYIILFILVLSFNMHCLFNGRIYKFIKHENLKRGNHYEKH